VGGLRRGEEEGGRRVNWGGVPSNFDNAVSDEMVAKKEDRGVKPQVPNM